MANLELAALEGKHAIPATFAESSIESDTHPIVRTAGYLKMRRWFGNTQGRGRVRAQRWLDDQLAMAEIAVAAAQRLAKPESMGPDGIDLTVRTYPNEIVEGPAAGIPAQEDSNDG
jgi:hypothetical protein